MIPRACHDLCGNLGRGRDADLSKLTLVNGQRYPSGGRSGQDFELCGVDCQLHMIAGFGGNGVQPGKVEAGLPGESASWPLDELISRVVRHRATLL